MTKTIQTDAELATIDTLNLDEVTGGCAACGNPNCGPGMATGAPNPAAAGAAAAPSALGAGLNPAAFLGR